MNNKPAVWRPSEEQLRVIEYLASGHSQNRTAAITKIPQQTISDWYQGAEFQALVAQKTAEFIASRPSVLDQTEALAQLIWHQALAGERRRDDPAVELAERYLSATVWKLRGGGHKQFGQP
jgi:hypothetical protein